MAFVSVESTRIPPLTPPWQLPKRVDVPFPELPSDADTELPSWRTGLHSVPPARVLMLL